MRKYLIDLLERAMTAAHSRKIHARNFASGFWVLQVFDSLVGRAGVEPATNGLKAGLLNRNLLFLVRPHSPKIAETRRVRYVFSTVSHGSLRPLDGADVGQAKQRKKGICPHFRRRPLFRCRRAGPE